MKRVLLIGGSGQLGTAIRQRWKDCEIIAPAHSELDVADAQLLSAALQRSGPDLVVNAAAFHDVDRCETDPTRAFEINAVAVGSAARLCAAAKAVFLTCSTDYVFDGKADVAYAEGDVPHPLSVYGASKLAGEHLAAAAHDRRFVVRTCGVYGPAASRSRGVPFLERIFAQAAEGKRVPVVADVTASPTFAGHLADALRKLVDSSAFGLYHAVNTGPVRWYDFAAEAARQAGIPVDLEPISAAQWKAQAVRPLFSALSNAKLAAVGIAMPPWQAGITAYLGVSRPFG